MKKSKLSAKFFSLVLALALALCCLPAAFAQESEITIDFSFYDGTVVIPKSSFEVKDGIAEQFGYTLADTQSPTVFDAIVAAHVSYYGNDFTEETCNNYLVMSSSFITKAFGKPTSALGFFINDKMPHDGVYNSDFYGYTGYSCDTAIIKANDYVSLFTYQDLSMYADYYITLSENNISVDPDEKFTVSATGYSAMWYGCSLEETIKANTYAMEGIEVYSTIDFKEYSKLGVLDENGEIRLSFNQPGKVFLCFKGEFEDIYGTTPVIANWCEVTVNEPVTEPSTDPAEAPDNNDACYIPVNIDVSLDADADKGILTVIFTFDFNDIKEVAPVKRETLSFSVNISWFSKIIEFVEGIIK